MALLRLSVMLLGASAVFASPAKRQETTVFITQTPAPTSTGWDAGAVQQYPIHSSCNVTERAQLEHALAETEALVTHAKEHILRWGNSSEIYQKYFGNASTAEPIGWYDKVANGDKAGVLFRCDNPDGNCQLEGWGGHWRGENATSETVICPLSYETRRSLVAMCGLGYTVANGATNFYFASDLLHRLFHIPKVGEGAVGHYAEEYDECLELAETNPEEAVRNSDTLQYFALDVYAFDIALPGEGCAGKFKATSSEAASATSSGVAASQTVEPTSTASKAASVTSAAPAECHTHGNGDVHCS